MIKCPFCYSKNDPGTRFCILCKSDISNAGPASESIVDVELVADESPCTEKALDKADLNTPEPAPLPDETGPASPKASQARNPSAISQEKNEFKLTILRGKRKDLEYRLAPGRNLIGRTDAKPVDVDLEPQEDSRKVWVSRQHAVIHVGEGVSIEDLNSSNGTYVNRERIFPGQKTGLKAGDMIQIGSVLMVLQ